MPDLKSAWRLARAGRWATATTVSTLSLAIAVTALLFALIEAVVLRPFPFPDLDRLVGVGATVPSLNQPLEFFEALSAPEYADIKRSTRALTAVTGFDLGNEQIMVERRPERIFTAYVWDDPLAALGMPPAIGRSFTRDDLERRVPVAVVSHEFWQTRFAGDARAIGAVIAVSGQPHASTCRSRASSGCCWRPRRSSPASFPRWV